MTISHILTDFENATNESAALCQGIHNLPLLLYIKLKLILLSFRGYQNDKNQFTNKLTN